MKVPPKRKGNLRKGTRCYATPISLNESPSEKEGKLAHMMGWSGALLVPQ